MCSLRQNWQSYSHPENGNIEDDLDEDFNHVGRISKKLPKKKADSNKCASKKDKTGKADGKQRKAAAAAPGRLERCMAEIGIFFSSLEFWCDELLREIELIVN